MSVRFVFRVGKRRYLTNVDRLARDKFVFFVWHRESIEFLCQSQVKVRDAQSLRAVTVTRESHRCPQPDGYAHGKI